MSEKTLKTRIQNKRGTTAEWATGTAPNFVPKDGEIVAYTDVHRIKVGDGTTKVSALPFVDKVRDVTLSGESIVNANGVVELQPTEMTDGYIPVWDNTEKIFKDGYNRNNVVTTDTAQTISGKKTFGGEPPVFDTGFTATAGTTFDADAAFNSELDLNCPIRVNNSFGTLGQVLVSQGTGNSPKWGDVVTIDTAQNITGTKTFNNINVTGRVALADCDINFQSADGAFQSLGISPGLSSSGITYFSLPGIEDEETTYELGTAMYCHYITAFTSGGTANFQVFCNRQTKFTSLSELYSSIMTLQDDTVVYIPATGVFYSSTFANVQIVKAVCFRSASIYVCTQYISKATSSETQTATSITDNSVYACNRTR